MYDENEYDSDEDNEYNDLSPDIIAEFKYDKKN